MTQPDPIATVLLPAHNAASTLEAALETLFAQTFEHFDIVAINDGSTDQTGEILDVAARTDRRLHPLHISHLGLVGALNRGIAASRGTYIARFDADDLAHPERLAKQVSYLDEHPEIDAVGCLVHCFPDEAVAEGFRVYETWINSLVTPEEIAREIYIESPLVHPSVTVRRDRLVEVGGYAEHGWPEDYDLWLRLHTSGSRFAKIPEVLHEWREGESRLTRTDSRYSVENFIRAKAHYMMQGPLADRRQLIIWGAGQMGRRISKHLLREGAEILAFVDIDPNKIGNTRGGAPIISPDDLSKTIAAGDAPWVLAAVPSRGARALIRQNLNTLGLVEGNDYICVA